jgi:hypothetical protein
MYPNMTLGKWGVAVAESHPTDALFNVPCTKYACTLGAFGAFRIPDTAAPDPSADGHLAVYDSSSAREWDMWQAVKSGTSWNASAGAAISTNGNGTAPVGTASGNAANFPLLGGLIRPEEILQGHIDHALAFGMPGVSQLGYVCPATHHDGTTTNPNALEEGTRLQLDPSVDVASLIVVLSGGAILSPAIRAAWTERLPGALLIDGFGASETGSQGQALSAAEDGPSRAPRFRVNDETIVLDEHLAPTPVGVVGKLARRGHVPLGYYKDAEKTTATFPVIDGVRWSVPGDDARLEDDGTITVLGRGSVSINTGGEKVYPEEVEGVLKSDAAVFDAVVVGVPDDRWGERVVAVVQLRPGASVTLDELVEHASSHVARYKVPRDLVIVDTIVRSPSGKPDYRWAKSAAMDRLGVEP